MPRARKDAEPVSADQIALARVYESAQHLDRKDGGTRRANLSSEYHAAYRFVNLQKERSRVDHPSRRAERKNRTEKFFPPVRSGWYAGSTGRKV